MAYRVTVDKDACVGIFACLVRDDRFHEADDGLVGIDPARANQLTESESEIVAEFDDDCIEQARQAAAACPPSAIVVEEVDEQDAPGAELDTC